MIRLATRLTLAAGRESVVRLTLTALGLAMATAMLLFAAVVLPALQSHDQRRGWMDTRAHNDEPAQDETTTDPLLWRLTETHFQGQDLVRVDVAAQGPDAPVPPGLDALPSAGELAVSPALAELLDETDPSLLADRFPGEVTAAVGDEALVSPDDLVVFVGRPVDELRTEPEVSTVRSIEAAPFSRSLTRVMRLAIAVGGVGLLAPVVAFAATATRLAAARRERRLAAMRLAGATPRQIGVVAAVDAALAGIVGTAAGFGLFLAIRPALADIPLDGATFFPADLRLSVSWAVLVALGVPLLSMVAAVVSVRRAQISPLGLTRRATRARTSPRPLLLVLAGIATLVVVQATMTGGSDVLVATIVGGAMLMMTLGIVGSGPWLTASVGRALARRGRRAPSLLAARRLQDNPASGFRAVGGLVLAVFVGTVFSSFAASILANEPDGLGDGLRPGVVGAALSPVLPPEDGTVRPGSLNEDDWPELGTDRQDQTVQGLEAIDGVSLVATAYDLPQEIVQTHLLEQGYALSGPAAAMRCDQAAAMGLEACDDPDGTTVVTTGGGGARSTGVDISDTVPASMLADMTVVGFAAVTDGSASAIEQSRAVLERNLPGSVASTQADLDAESKGTTRSTQRVSNIGLAVTLVIAGCSLAVAVAGSIVERRQPFALLRLAGTRLSDLRRIVLTEAVAPLLIAAVATVGLGLAVTALTLEAGANNPAFALPAASYWLSLLGGLVVALGVVTATLPLLNRLTSPETVRFE